MFKDTDKGFHITFANGCTVSVQWNAENYCENHGVRNANVVSRTAEMAAWDANGDWIILPDSVAGWQTPDQVAAFIAEVASQ